MREKYTSGMKRVRQSVASNLFFVSSLVVFSLHTLWLIFSSNLLPYDEYYHIGIIKLYARQWSPFMRTQPPEASLYGDVTRLPSYLYHYLMSFPYRFFVLFTHDQTILIILLRLLNLAMVVGGLILFRKLFLRARISRPIINLSVAVFALTPITVILSAQNNYDNMMFLLMPIFLLQAYYLVTKPPTLRGLLYFASVGMLACLVKNSFVIIFGIVGLYVLARLLMIHKTSILSVLHKSVRAARKASLIAGIVFVVVLGLFVERYGVNELKYKQVAVDCDRVQSIEVCSQYTVWNRNQNAVAHKSDYPALRGPAQFTQYWVQTIMRGYFTIFANIIPDNLHKHDPYGEYELQPMIRIPVRVGCLLLGAGLILLVAYGPQLWKNNDLNRMSLLSGGGLAAALWIFNYTFYRTYGEAYAIQARYILPMLLPLIVVIAQAYVLATRSVRLQWMRPILIILIVAYLLSGGAFGWIIRAQPTWYWHNSVVLKMNQYAQKVLDPIIWN